ncbi:MAG TPA: MFS transporter [Roseiarcus sp.]|nr:MFS transporter [Roseiarcus sp.]
MFKGLFPLILGAFAIGTETFMIVGVLPNIVADLGVSPAAGGALVTAFSLAYALGSPVLAVLTAGLERKRLLAISMGGFALANALAALSPNFASLMAARVGLAVTAGTFMPAAVAFATATFGPLRRGRAVALVYSGMTLAIVLGVPGGTMITAAANWRAAFLAVALLAALVLMGVVALLPRLDGLGAVSLRERIAVARRPDVLALLSLTALALCGAFAINTYVGLLLRERLGVDSTELAGVLMGLGLVSFAGNWLGGYGADRLRRERLLAVILAVLVAAFALISIGAHQHGPPAAVAIGVGLFLWGLFGWAFPATQQARIVSLDPQLAPITLSLNTSAIYVGAAAGSVLGGLAIMRWSVAAIGWVGSACEIGAFILLMATAARSILPRPRTIVAPEPAE